MIWNIILTLAVCLILAFLVVASILLLGKETFDNISNDDIYNFMEFVFVLAYIILIALVFTGTIGLGKLSLLVVVVFVIISIICRNKNKLLD